MVQKTVLKIDLECQKCKTKVLKAVSIEGVDKIEVDEEKGTLAVTGDADPCVVITRARDAVCSAGKYAEVVSVGPPPKPEDKKPDVKKPDDKKPDPPAWPYPPCEPVAFMVSHDPYSQCSIL